MKKLSVFAVLVLLLTSTVFAAPGDVLYQADWSSGMNGWAGSSDWKTVNGMLVNDGTNAISTPITNIVTAPYEPGSHDIANYAVETEIQVVREGWTCNTLGFGVLVRLTQQGGYLVGAVPANCSTAFISAKNDVGYVSRLTDKGFTPGTDWHTYRIEVQDNTIRLLVDGAPLLETIDNRYLSGGQVGLYSGGIVLNVRSFKVIQL